MLKEKLAFKLFPTSIIKNSSLFNSDYYSLLYSINKKKAAKHYLKKGWKKGFNPSINFNTDMYIRRYPDVNLINPLLHYEIYGKNENRRIFSSEPVVTYGSTSNVMFNDIFKYLGRNSFYDLIKKVFVVIPVYNAYDQTKRLLENVFEKTPENVDIVIADDCSTDERIKPLINKYKPRHNCRIVKNDVNLGFVGNINRAVAKECGGGDIIIILNTDTIVPSNWVEKMVAPYYESELVASTTPFTNRGVFFSFPDFGVDNEFRLDLERINKAADNINVKNDDIVNIPSGCGFCMSINKKVWDEIGPLDEKTFGKGYGEENDWCFRAFNAGYCNKLVPNLFVIHDHGKSFAAAEKKKLMHENELKLREKYSTIINELIPSFVQKDEWVIFRLLLSLLYYKDKIALIIDIRLSKDSKSGALQYTERIRKEYENNQYGVVYIRYYGEKWEIVVPSISDGNSMELSRFSDISLLFSFFDIKEVFVNNLAYNPNPENVINVLCHLKSEYKFKLVYPFHDHLSVCPSFFLLDNNYKICNYIDEIKCKNCIKDNSHLAVERHDVKKWRMQFGMFFNYVDEFLFFSEYTKKIVSDVYPVVSKGIVKYHEPVINNLEYKYKKNEKKQVTVGFVGTYCIEKGSQYFDRLIERLQRELNIEAIVIGFSYGDCKWKKTGKYEHDDLGKLLYDNEVDFVVYTSIANETFSYVVQELMLLEYPIVSFTCGGHAERLKLYNRVEFADSIDDEALYEAAIKMISRINDNKI